MNSVPTFNAPVSRLTQSPRIYYVHPLLLKGYEAWGEVFAHAKALGFDTVLTAPLFERGSKTSIFVSRRFDRLDADLGLGEEVDDGLSRLSKMAAEQGLRLMLDLVIDRIAREDRGTGDIAADPRIGPDASCSQSVDLSPSETTYN